MRSLERDIQRLIESFVDGVHSIVRESVLGSLDLLGQATAASRTPRARSTGADSGRGTPRVSKVGERFRAFVAAHPGVRIEEINAKLGTSSSDLRYPIRKLVESGVIVKRGQARATRYYPLS
jgi:hypothetical protein